MIRRLKLFWKLSLIAALIPISVVAGMAVSLQGASQLEAEYDTLYRFMRTSIQVSGSPGMSPTPARRRPSSGWSPGSC